MKTKNVTEKNMKVCLVGSSGGHLTHLYMLKPFWKDKNRFWVTFDKEDARSLLEGEKVYPCYFPTNRSIKALIKNTKIAWDVLHKEKPDLIISCGAAVAVPFFYIGKMMGAKLVYIEVFDRIDKPTMTGKMVYPIVDKFVVQWEEQKKVYMRLRHISMMGMEPLSVSSTLTQKETRQGLRLVSMGELYQCNEKGYIGQITYLGADGNPAPTNAGYTILKRTYHRDGTADTDMYFDANGNPKALSKGQYGIKRSGKVNLLLERNGNVMLCVDNLLNGFPCMVVVFGCVVCLLMIVLPKSLSVVLTIVYVAFILYETLMFRESGDARTNFVLFSYAGKFLKEQSVRVGVINNIWLFIPLGTGLYRWFQKKWVLLIPFVMSVAIETTQYITGLGLAEFDDVFGNTMGGWIGILTAYAVVSQIS